MFQNVFTHLSHQSCESSFPIVRILHRIDQFRQLFYQVNDDQRSTKSSASIERFPFIVALINATSGSKTPLCTGSIVSSDVVLTSGFCTKYKLAVNDIALTINSKIPMVNEWKKIFELEGQE
ncbi:unnamed protein product, partial [Nesidiocoris tenuis]